ncbi:hypothetical protein SCLCIDRAFT_783658 [Scleroderma citrinum Foug A]|uniref:Uncharacterized protein n=1 Tax=Scleroderma citrinum Foug A TaxID=1036808 RepID=A0A0C2ZMW2_9AGAM|nr:hypothetical protein SCLCIDRAFT_783658 [Scleroderma citrinum Foug A]
MGKAVLDLASRTASLSQGPPFKLRNDLAQLWLLSGVRSYTGNMRRLWDPSIGEGMNFSSSISLLAHQVKLPHAQCSWGAPGTWTYNVPYTHVSRWHRRHLSLFKRWAHLRVCCQAAVGMFNSGNREGLTPQRYHHDLDFNNPIRLDRTLTMTSSLPGTQTYC